MKIAASFALIALASAGGASAQATGQSGMSSSGPLNNVRAFGDLRALGSCVARTQRREALSVIATVPDSPEEREALRRVMYGERSNCMFGGTTMTMPDVFARGALAEGLFLSGGAPQEYWLAAPAPSETRDLHGVARCYVARHRTEARRLIEIEPGSPAEVAAVRAIWDDFRACMPDFNVRLNAPWIRFLVVEALLRLPPEPTGA